jgi:hypothetical protein
MATKQEIFEEHKTEYFKASKKRKGEILNIVCGVTKMHRKAAVRKFGRLQRRDPLVSDGRGRHEYYTPDITLALKEIWEADSEVCGELLHPMIGEYVGVLSHDRMWKHGDEITGKLLAMSERTVKRRVGNFMKARRRYKGMSATSPSHLKTIIPMFSGPWQDKPPGWSQVDTVVHCGHSLLGDMAYTLNETDVATMWGTRRAQWNKGQEATKESMREIKKRKPFPWLGAHPDTGSEFINYPVVDWCKEEGIEMTRSRPGHSNDNMHVEERNGHIVRKFVGYARYDCKEAVDALNDLYEVLTPYLNHFVASKKCVSKEKVGAKYVRKYEKAQTPYQRVLAHPAITEDVKEKLRMEHAKLNPLRMKREIDTLTDKLLTVQKRFGGPKETKELR